MSRTMNLSLVLSARDQTGGAISSVVGGLGKIVSFAKSASLGLVGINFGVRPLISGIDNLVDRGTRLEVIRKQFSSLTGTTGANIDVLAKRIQNASASTLRLGQSMEIANRGLAMGLGLKQLVTAAEFAAKKATAIGEEPAALLERIVNDLGKGTTRVLDDLGLLRGGIEGVARSYDAIYGSKAFDNLDEASKKAVIASAAVGEMERSMRSLGVSGKETFFQWQGIKTQIGDSVDKLVLAVTSSKAMKDAVGGLRDFLAGVTEHFEGNPAKGIAPGTFGQLLFGKGKSGGLAGIAAGLLQDAGAALWDGLKGGVDWTIGKFGEWRDTLVAKLGDLLFQGIGKFEAWRDKLIEGLAELIAKLAAVLQPIVSAVESALSKVADRLGDLANEIGLTRNPDTGKPRVWAEKGFAGRAASAVISNPIGAWWTGVKQGWDAIGTGIGSAFSWLPWKKPAADQAKEFLDRTEDRYRGLVGPQSNAAGAAFMPGLGAIPIGNMLGGAMLTQGPGRGAFRSNLEAFLQDFPGTTPAQNQIAAGDLMRHREAIQDAAGRYALTPAAQARIRTSIRRNTQALNNYVGAHSTAGIRDRAEAVKAARQQIADLQRAGFKLTDYDRADLIYRAVEQRQSAVSGRLQSEIDLGNRILSGEKARTTNPAEVSEEERRTGGPSAKSVDELIQTMKQVVNALTNASSDIRRATA